MNQSFETVLRIVQNLNREEETVVRFLLESGVDWAEAAAIVLANRDRMRLKSLLAARFPSLSDQEISAILTQFVDILAFGFSPEEVFSKTIAPYIERAIALSEESLAKAKTR
ncbi:hypothetical protein [Paraburkholderia sp. Ac-20347]|uniref:hypothetical protein n=1 Tax=Paraburkholderia sp. Ac-20347 TaxID=2703892 RepID=UPI00197F1052|nr:hypothetical protein [Paraburkholderia sp. Ac-20347]MBN3808771.1 hypothetical protein [Paraburkholderia sp. Ac-20347]